MGKIVVNIALTIEIDPAVWMLNYGTAADQVLPDVTEYFDTLALADGLPEIITTGWGALADYNVSARTVSVKEIKS